MGSQVDIVNFQGKELAILGAGVTGNSVARVLAERGADVVLIDDDPKAQSAFPIYSPESIDISAFSSIIVSPGWPRDHPLINTAIELGLDILNEIDIAFTIAQEISPAQKWLALTGTNGKTTTVEMAAAMLTRAGLKALACGNVGETVIDAVTHHDPYDYLILELSSFQLHWMRKARFTSAAILNIADDHLDWHGGFEAYAAAKFSILNRTDIAILNAQDLEVVERAEYFKGRKVFFSLQTPAPGELGIVEDILVDRAFVIDASEAAVIASIDDIQPSLPHSVLNALAATALARSVNVAYEDIQGALKDFHPGHHRIETILSCDGIVWIDDSKATNPHAAAASIMSHLSVIWIAGGLAKGADMDALIRRTHKRMKAVILIGADRELIAAAMAKHSPATPIIKIDSRSGKGEASNTLMERVVEAAKLYASQGDTVLLAPACASMDQFISYADRGERFASAVKKLVPHAK